MSFQFSLQSLLRYRRSTEQREWLKLQVIAQKLAAARNDIMAIQRIQCDARLRFSREMAVGVSAAEIQFERNCERGLQDACARARLTFEELERQHDAQRIAFTWERQKRETLEKLRENERERYNRDLDRRDQNRADELFLMRRSVLPG